MYHSVIKINRFTCLAQDILLWIVSAKQYIIRANSCQLKNTFLLKTR